MRRDDDDDDDDDDDEAVTFLTSIHETNRNVIFPSCFPSLELRLSLF